MRLEPTNCRLPLPAWAWLILAIYAGVIGLYTWLGRDADDAAEAISDLVPLRPDVVANPLDQFLTWRR